MSTETTSVTDDSDSTSVADLDPDQLSDSDRLYQMAQSIRDDDLFELPVIDWEKQHGSVEITIITPDGTTSTVQQSWPEKPTDDYEFVRTCMCALDVDDAETAALMADELQDVSHDEFTVPVDRSSRGWTIDPNAGMRDPLTQRLRRGIRAFFDPGSTYTSVLSFVFGPCSLVIGTYAVVLEALSRSAPNPKPVLDDETYIYARNFVLALLGLIGWSIVLAALAL